MSTSRNSIKKFRQLQNYEYGDMVWAKYGNVWWPGQIHHEALLEQPLTTKSRKDGDVCVAFFQDTTYSWYNPAKLIPFEENFHKKSRQIISSKFQIAKDEAIQTLSWRMGLGSACQCRTRSIFLHPNVTDYVKADGKDGQLWDCPKDQIRKARDFFRPRDVLSFIRKLALSPMKQTTLEFVKNKAIVLECREALFREVDETYKQAFGIVSTRPLHAMPRTVVNPLEATTPLSAQELVKPQALDRANASLKLTKKEKSCSVSRVGNSKATKSTVVELSRKNELPAQNKRPKQDVYKKPVLSLRATRPQNIAKQSKATTSRQEPVTPKAFDKAESKATKRYVVELSHLNAGPAQVKRQKQNKSRRDANPFATTKVTKPSVSNPQSTLTISQPPLPLKSCLKKPSGSRNNLSNTVPVSSSAAARPMQFPSFSYSSAEQQVVSTNVNPDISRQMFRLLLECRRIVENVTMALGYTPYHPL